VQVLKEAGRRAQSQSYLWVQRGGPPDGRVILYDYDPSRSGAVPQRLLAGYRGYLQTDGYDGYNAVVATNGLKQLGCMAHARRRFDEAVKAQGKNKRGGKAWRGLSLIQKLYRVEKQARPMSTDERHAYRIVHAKPVLDEMRGWLDAVLPQVLPNGAVGKALNYLHNGWDKLTRYLDDGRLEIDNNLCENAVRPFVIGRKAWLFSDSVAGVNASANLYSLLETAKSHGLEPYAIYARSSRNCLARRQLTLSKRCCRAISASKTLIRIEQGCGLRIAYYRGKKQVGETDIFLLRVPLKRDTRYRRDKKRNRCRRRAAIEPLIGHLKHDQRLGRCFLKGVEGDQINL
jgi:transposase